MSLLPAFTRRPRWAAPYSRLATGYDIALGRPFFVRARRAFEHLVRRYGIEFRSAADLGCGTGLFACYVHRRWRVPVLAVDRSSAMLRVAAGNCSEPRVRFLRQDMRHLCLPHRVDVITANFDALNHVVSPHELRAVFQRVREHLNPGGHFIFDIVTPCQRWRQYTRWLPTPRGELVQRACWDRARRLLSIAIVERRPFLTAIELHTERAYSPLDVGRWLERAGFQVRGIHDAGSLEPAASCPPRAIIVARRRDGARPCDADPVAPMLDPEVRR